ncbi:MAG: SDR family oxidoreductase [Ardenticatenaceae bacterium]|nr:SDR family oxidoreductase [Ardenticatenaceae bacterium]
MTTEKPLAGKVAVVTGAGRGIGKAIALGFAAAGASVGCGARTAVELTQTVGDIEAAGGRALAVVGDVAEETAVFQLINQTAAAFGGLDILVINAGMSPAKTAVADSNPADWQRTLEVNLLGAYHCTRAAIPHLQARGGGKIITVGSGLGHRGLAGGSAYAVSKAGLWMFTRVLAQELWPDNISVNELIPGPVDTAMTSTGPSNPDSVASISGEWMKQPKDVVPLALFLATQPTIGPTAQSFSLMRRDWA